MYPSSTFVWLRKGKLQVGATGRTIIENLYTSEEPVAEPLDQKVYDSLSECLAKAETRALTLMGVARYWTSQSGSGVGLWGQEPLECAPPQKEQECRNLQLEKEQPSQLKLLQTIRPP